jgi:DNA-directed RNA polymerase subunit RPC12/RpoP
METETIKIQCEYCGYWTDEQKEECWNCGRKLEKERKQ